MLPRWRPTPTCLAFRIALVVLIALSAFRSVAHSGTSTDDLTAFNAPERLVRVALVIGARHYEKLPPVPNAWNDLQDAATILKGAGFSFVRVLRDPRENDFYDFTRELSAQAGATAEPAIIVVYFSGHGFQLDGNLYLAPVEADPAALPDTGIPVVNLADTLLRNRRGGMTIFFLDACRTPVRAASPPGSIAFAVSAGAIFGVAASFNAPARNAAYQGASNSPYTDGLIRYLPRRGMSLTDAHDLVRDHVLRVTQEEQTPELHSNAFGSRFYFILSETQRDADASAWSNALRTGRRECVQTYVRKHPDGAFVKSALGWLSQVASQSSNDGGLLCPED